MPIQYPHEYYARFDPEKKYDRHLFIAGRVLQSAEVNEIQLEQHHRLKGVADAIFKDGDIVRDCQVIIDRNNGRITCQSGAMYVAGAVRGVPEASFAISMTGHVQVGVWLKESVVTDVEDPDLRDPAAGVKNYRQAGAARLKAALSWGLAGGGDGAFYPIWDIDDGELRPRTAPPGMEAFELSLAKYDRDSAGGHYIVSGLRVKQENDLPNGKQVYTVSDGSARVAGRGLEMSASKRVTHDASPDLLWVDSEPHSSSTLSEQRVLFDRWPIAGIPEVRITTRRTVEITHGGFEGVADPMPDASVIVIEEVKQGGTTYQSGASWTFTAGQLDWSPSGPEPAPGSTYQVTYQYIKQADITNLDDRGFTVSGAIENTLILVSYNHALRRIDRLCLNDDGTLSWLTGVPSQWNPVPPRVPYGKLSLASVYQTWDSRRKVVEDGVRMVPMQELANYQSQLNAIREDQAELRLAVDVSGRYTGIKKGLFADPFLSNDHRDVGLDQDALISGGILSLPIDYAAHSMALDITRPVTTPHTHAPVLAQTARTGGMKVNPYMAFVMPPAQLALVPSMDRWVETTTKLLPPRLVGSGIARIGGSTELVSETHHETGLIRPIRVNFTLKGFGDNGPLRSLLFDGLDVTPSPQLVADHEGNISGHFTIPSGVSAGTKLVEAFGAGGLYASALFTGSSLLIERNTRQVFYSYDPLAQTFTLPSASQVSGVDLVFTAIGSTDVTVQIRSVENGVPARGVVAEATLSPPELSTSGYTRFTWPPVLLNQDQEYAIVVMCNDAATSCAIAELGKLDVEHDRWVTSQPYQVGVLLSSSNNSTWTAHQDRDLTFRLLAPQYTNNEHILPLGSVDVTDATDLIAIAFASIPSLDTSFLLRLQIGSDPAVDVSPGQVMRLQERYTGSIAVSAVFRGSSKFAPVMEPGVSLVAGSIHGSGTYISPMLTASGTSTLRVIFESNLPSGATIEVHASTETTPTSWTSVPLRGTSPYTAGAVEFTYELGSISGTGVRFRITLNGTHKARPEAMNLRAVVL